MLFMHAGFFDFPLLFMCTCFNMVNFWFIFFFCFLAILIETFLLKIIKSPNRFRQLNQLKANSWIYSTFAHKMMSLVVVFRMCRDPQVTNSRNFVFNRVFLKTLVDLFLNYDCDLSSPSLFRAVIFHLEKVLLPNKLLFILSPNYFFQVFHAELYFPSVPWSVIKGSTIKIWVRERLAQSRAGNGSIRS